MYVRLLIFCRHGVLDLHLVAAITLLLFPMHCVTHLEVYFVSGVDYPLSNYLCAFMIYLVPITNSCFPIMDPNGVNDGSCRSHNCYRYTESFLYSW